PASSRRRRAASESGDGPLFPLSICGPSPTEMQLREISGFIAAGRSDHVLALRRWRGGSRGRRLPGHPLVFHGVRELPHEVIHPLLGVEVVLVRLVVDAVPRLGPLGLLDPPGRAHFIVRPRCRMRAHREREGQRFPDALYNLTWFQEVKVCDRHLPLLDERQHPFELLHLFGSVRIIWYEFHRDVRRARTPGCLRDEVHAEPVPRVAYYLVRES